MARRLRLTGFTRFIIVMLFLVPIAYIGASYYNGQDGIENVKGFIGLDGKSGSKTTTRNRVDDSDRNTQLHDRITELELKNSELENELEKKDQQIVDLRSRLNKCK